MLIYKPTYFDTFRCIASACPDSCCKEWEVEIDDDTAAYYRTLSGPLGDRLRNVLVDDPEYGTVMSIENHRCPMWRADGLCTIQAELGHDALCKTCRDFPRLRHDYGSFAELGLELSCPEAARIILTAPSAPLLSYEISGGDEPDYDTEAMQILLETRKYALHLLYDPAYSVAQALSLLLMYGYHAQALLDGDEALSFDPEEALRNAYAWSIDATSLPLADFFQHLEILTPQWATRLNSPAVSDAWTDQYRPLAFYFVQRYWLQAVSDYDLVSRVKMAVISCLLIRSLGGDMASTAQLYSKEIENSTENVDALLDGTYTCPAFTDRHLLFQLLRKT